MGFEELPSGPRPKSMSMLSRVKSTITDRPRESIPWAERESLTVNPSSPQPSPKKIPQRPAASPKSGILWEKVESAWARLTSSQELQLMEGQVAMLQSRLTERDVISSSVSQQLGTRRLGPRSKKHSDSIAADVVGASSEQSRRAISDKLKQLSRKLTTDYSNEGNYSQKRERDHFPSDAVYQPPERIEMGTEARPVVRIPRMNRENEMIEFKTPAFTR